MSRLAILSLFLLAAPAAAQANRIPDLPRTEEILKKVGELLDEAPEETASIEGVAKLVYKKIPLDVHAVALKFGATLSGSQQPTETLERYVRQFEGRIGPFLDQRLADVGQLEVLAPLELKGKTIPVGTYKVGVALDGGRPAALILTGEALARGKPTPLKLKPRRLEGEQDPDGALKLQLAEPPAKDEKKPAPKKPEPRGLDLIVTLRNQEATARLTVEAPSEKK